MPTSRAILRVLVAAVVAAAAASGVVAHAPALADRDVIGVVGLADAGPFGGLAALVAAPFALLPIGTRALRAGLASAACAALLGAMAFELARAASRSVLARTALVGPRDEGALRSRLVDAVSAAAALTALFAPAVQAESRLPGGAIPGALVVVVAAWLAVGEDDREATLPWLALLAGLATCEGPLVLLAVLAVLGPRARAAPRTRDAVGRAALAFVVGLSPLLLRALVRVRASSLGLDEPFAAALPWTHPGTVSGALGFFRREVFVVVLAAAVAGVVLAARGKLVARLAPVAIAAALGVAGLALGDGGARNAGPLAVAGVVALHAFAAVGLAALPLAIARAPVPFAGASAALVVVLELVIPVRAFDEASLRRAAEPAGAALRWADDAFAELASGALVLVGSRPLALRVAAARAAGQVRGDLAFVPLYAPRGVAATRALAANPDLAPVFRDVLLGVPPEELSFARAAQARPLALVFDPAWDRSVARHLVPVGLFGRFDPEPRAASDRRAALEAFVPARERLTHVASRAVDPALARHTATLLRARALAVATTGDREALSRALDDLRPFAPEDPVAAQLVRRIVTTKGAIDVKDLPLEP